MSRGDAPSQIQKGLQIALIALGALNLLGFVTSQGWMRGLAIASVASPLPFVFSSFRGYEIIAYPKDGQNQRIAITPALYAELGGSYNRRNTYGAAASYGPRMSKPEEAALVEQVLFYGLCNEGPLAQRLHNPTLGHATFIVRSRTAGSVEVWRKDFDCGDR